MHAVGIFLIAIFITIISYSSTGQCSYSSSSNRCIMVPCSESSPPCIATDFPPQEICQGGNGSISTTLHIQSDMMGNLSSATFDFLTIRTGTGQSGLFFQGLTQIQDIGSAGTKHEQRKNPLTFSIDRYEKPINQTYYSFTLHFDLRDARTEDERQFYITIEYEERFYEAPIAWFLVIENCPGLPDEAEGRGANTNEWCDKLYEALRQLRNNMEEDTAGKLNITEASLLRAINELQTNCTKWLNETKTEIISSFVKSMRDITNVMSNRTLMITMIVVVIFNFFSTPFWHFVISRLSSRRKNRVTRTDQTQDENDEALQQFTMVVSSPEEGQTEN